MFKVGDKFSYHCPFTGGYISCVITEVRETEVLTKSINAEIDGTFDVEETYPLKTDENGQYIEMWKCGGHVAKCYSEVK